MLITIVRRVRRIKTELGFKVVQDCNAYRVFADDPAENLDRGCVQQEMSEHSVPNIEALLGRGGAAATG